MDVTDSQSVHSTIEEISNKHGRLDGLIAAAGINIEKSALEHTTQDFEKMFSINVTGCFLAAQAAAKVMIEKGTPGSIALIASMSGTIANKVRKFSSHHPIYYANFTLIRISSALPTTLPKPPSFN